MYAKVVVWEIISVLFRNAHSRFPLATYRVCLCVCVCVNGGQKETLVEVPASFSFPCTPREHSFVNSALIQDKIIRATIEHYMKRLGRMIH